MSEYILVHGTTQSPLGWLLVSQGLQARGHRVTAVDLPLDQPAWVAADYARHVRRACNDVGAAPIVVAHSGSGLLLPAIAHALNAAHQVWLAAFVPSGDASLLDELNARPDSIFSPDWIGRDPTSDPEAARRFLFHDCDRPTLDWAMTTLRLFHPAAAYTSVDPGAPVRTAPSTYVLPEHDRTLRPHWMREAARDRLGVEPVTIDAGHCPHVSRPDEVVGILTEAI